MSVFSVSLQRTLVWTCVSNKQWYIKVLRRLRKLLSPYLCVSAQLGEPKLPRQPQKADWCCRILRRLFGLLLTLACFLLDIKVVTFENRNKAAGYNQHAVGSCVHRCCDWYFTCNLTKKGPLVFQRREKMKCRSTNTWGFWPYQHPSYTTRTEAEMLPWTIFS